MSERSIESAPSWLTHLGDIRWVRAHISTFCIGAVLLVCINLLMGSAEMWSLTAIGIWIMLLLVHIVIVLIARLSTQLLADDDDEEVVLLPVKDAVIIQPKADPPASWTTPTATTSEQVDTPGESDTVSWSVATDMAQVKRNSKEDKAE